MLNGIFRRQYADAVAKAEEDFVEFVVEQYFGKLERHRTVFFVFRDEFLRRMDGLGKYITGVSVVRNEPNGSFLKTVMFCHTHHIVEVVVAEVRILFEGYLRTWMEVLDTVKSQIEELHVASATPEDKPAIVKLFQEIREQNKLGCFPGVERAVPDIDRAPRGYQVVKGVEKLDAFKVRVAFERYNSAVI